MTGEATTDPDCPPFCPAEAGGDCDHDPGFVIPGWRVDWLVPATERCPRCGKALAMSEYGIANSCGDCFGGRGEGRRVAVVVEPLTYLRCSVCGTPVQDDTCPHCGDIA